MARVVPVVPTRAQQATFDAWLASQAFEPLDSDWLKVSKVAGPGRRAAASVGVAMRAKGAVQSAPGAKYHGTCSHSGRVYIEVGRIWVTVDRVW